jgi:quinol monooxygenase YgiN
MADDLYWLFTARVCPGQFDAFKALVADIVRATRQEPGTLAYQYAVSTDQQTVHIFERYRDSEAFVTHAETTFAGYAERFLALVAIESVLVYGAPSAQARKILDRFNPTYMALFDGFARG